MISKGKYKDKMMKVVAYLRISTTKQTSIREQKSIVKQFIQKNKYELVELITDEGVSGTSADRDGWNRIAVAGLERLWENQSKFYILMKKQQFF